MRRTIAFAGAALLLASAAAIYTNASAWHVMSYDEWYSNAHMLVAASVALVGTTLAIGGRAEVAQSDAFLPPGELPVARHKNWLGIGVLSLGAIAFWLLCLIAFGELESFKPTQGGLQFWTATVCSITLTALTVVMARLR